jgi:hypothetical protein
MYLVVTVCTLVGVAWEIAGGLNKGVDLAKYKHFSMVLSLKPENSACMLCATTSMSSQ